MSYMFKHNSIPKKTGAGAIAVYFSQNWSVCTTSVSNIGHGKGKVLSDNLSWFKVFLIWMQYKCEVHPCVWVVEHFLPLEHSLRSKVHRAKEFLCKKAKGKIRVTFHLALPNSNPFTHFNSNFSCSVSPEALIAINGICTFELLFTSC